MYFLRYVKIRGQKKKLIKSQKKIMEKKSRKVNKEKIKKIKFNSSSRYYGPFLLLENGSMNEKFSADHSLRDGTSPLHKQSDIQSRDE